MRPKIDDTLFGSITIAGQRYEHDVVIGLKGKVRKRNKQLSKEVYGTSHKISLAEIKDIYRDKAAGMIVGAGQDGQVHLSPEAAAFLEKEGCEVTLRPTPEAIKLWNEAEGELLGLFHVTC